MALRRRTASFKANKQPFSGLPELLEEKRSYDSCYILVFQSQRRTAFLVRGFEEKALRRKAFFNANKQLFHGSLNF
jgi:hypothetical protein